MKYTIVILSVLLILSCNKKVTKHETENDEILAKWNGGSITLSEFRDIYLETPKSALKNEFTFDSIPKELMNFIKIKEILKIADSLKFDTVKTISRNYSDNLTALCFKTIQNDSIRDKVITPEMILKMYENKKYDYRISHILIANSNNSDKLLDSIFKALCNNPNLFSETAKIHSNDTPTAKIGGDLGWMNYEELPEEFRDFVGPDLKGKISKPFKSKYGSHIVIINDVREAQKKVRSFAEEKHDIIKYLENKYWRQIERTKYRFDDFLFRKYNVKIDTSAVDSAVFHFNCIKSNKYDENVYLKDMKNNIVITSFGNLEYKFKIILTYFHTYYPDIQYINRYAVIESAHSMLRRILADKAVADLGYTQDPVITLKIKYIIAEDYKKYFIYNYIVPKIVEDLEKGIIKTFPSLEEIELQWQTSLFDSISPIINYDALKSIK